jgi:hypothetical protein
MSRRLLAAAGLALAGGFGTALVLQAATPAGAQEEFTVSAAQLRINQRISQAGVRRSNDALKRVAALEARPDPSKGTADDAPFVLTFFAPVSGTSAPQPAAPAGSTPPAVGVVGTEFPETGLARVIFSRPVNACAFSATVVDEQSGQISATSRSASAPGNRAVDVRTRASDGTPQPRSFHLMVFCPPS